MLILSGSGMEAHAPAKRQRIYRHKHLSDLNGIWKLSAFFEITQETANEHCRALRVGRDDLAEKDLTWVLFKTDIAVERYPRLGETVTVETFTKKRFMHFLPRY